MAKAEATEHWFPAETGLACSPPGQQRAGPPSQTSRTMAHAGPYPRLLNLWQTSYLPQHLSMVQPPTTLFKATSVPPASTQPAFQQGLCTSLPKYTPNPFTDCHLPSYHPSPSVLDGAIQPSRGKKWCLESKQIFLDKAEKHSGFFVAI